MKLTVLKHGEFWQILHDDIVFTHFFKEHCHGAFLCFAHRGDQFRLDFSLLGQLRSVIPDRVHFIATTATATIATFTLIRDRLFLKDPKIVALPPEKANVHYSVVMNANFEEYLSTITEELTLHRTVLPKTIIFCRKLIDCSKVYLQIRHTLGENFTDPPSSPDTHDFHMVSMYHSAATEKAKGNILRTFCTDTSKLRILIATTAFGLGVDCPDIRRVIHWGPPNDLDAYVQETGRGGRDGKPCKAILLYGHISKFTGQDIRNFASIETCRRVHLFRAFLKGEDVMPRHPGCTCCDICTKQCECENCLM